MKNNVRYFIVLLLCVAAWGYLQGPTVPQTHFTGPAPPPLPRSFAEHDWWMWTSTELFEDIADSGVAGMPISTDYPGADPSLRFTEDSVNKRCWSLELMGRSGRQSFLPQILAAAEDRNWKVRCAALIAAARLQNLNQVNSALESDLKITRHQSPQIPGRGGVAAHFYPLVMCAQKALTQTAPTEESIPLILKGLQARSQESEHHDRTPEPFPVVVSREVPGWYIETAESLLVQAGSQATSSLRGELSQPDFSFKLTEGGWRQHRHGAVQPADRATSLHALVQRVLNRSGAGP